MAYNKRLIYIALVAFIIYQLVNFAYLPLSFIFSDEHRFIGEAITFAKTGEFWVGEDRAWEMPLTAIIYGSIYKITSNIENTIVVIRIFQSCLLILQAFIMYKIAHILFKNETIALFIFVGILIYPFNIYHQALMLSETIFITILVLAVFYMYKWYDSEFISFKYFILSNIFLVLTIYSKGTLSILPPILISLFYLINTLNYKKFIRIFLLSVLIYICLMSLWWVRNYTVFNQFIPFTTSSASNLYLGANSNNLHGGVDWNTDVDKEFVKEVRSLDNEISRNKMYKDKAVQFIINHPLQYMKLMWIKFKRFYKVGLNTDAIQNKILNIIASLSSGIIYIGTIFFLFFNIKMWKKFSAIFILIGYFTLIHITFIASVRYRLPLDSFFILFSVSSVYNLFQKIRMSN